MTRLKLISPSSLGCGGHQGSTSALESAKYVDKSEFVRQTHYSAMCDYMNTMLSEVEKEQTVTCDGGNVYCDEIDSHS